MNKLNYNTLKVYFNSGIISHIYTHLLEAFTDFHGVLTGTYKVVTENKANDAESSLEIKTLNIYIDNVIFVNEKNYLKDDLPDLLDKIGKKYSTVVGIISARSYSYSTLSLKDQSLFIKAYNILKDKSEIPFLYGIFCHNEDNDGVKGITFFSKLYMLKE
jgi:hypothetical protein